MSAPALPKLDDTYGAMLIGVIVGAALWGVSAVQVWFYFTCYPNDQWQYKWLVAGVFVSDTIHQILVTHCVYAYLVSSFGNYVELDNIVWSIILEILFNGFTALLVQSFMTVRIWRLTPQKWRWQVTGLVAALVLAEFLTVFIYFVRAFQIKTFTELTILKSTSMSINAIGAAGDAVIAVVMCLMLQRSRTGFKNSNTMINTLTIFTVNTSFLTSMCAVASLVSILAAPTTFIDIAFFFNIGRLYSNSLLATLNARDSILGTLSDTQTVRNIRLQDSVVTAPTLKQSGMMLAITLGNTAYNSDAASGISETEVPTEKAINQ